MSKPKRKLCYEFAEEKYQKRKQKLESLLPKIEKRTQPRITTIFSPELQIRNRLSSLVQPHFKNAIKYQHRPTIKEVLGYSSIELYEYLSKWLNKPCEDCNSVEITMKNHHIDHIIPVSSVYGQDNVEEKIIALFNLENLRLICPTCNIKKGNRPQ